MKWIGRAIAALLCAWALLVGVVAVAMLQTPERFGRFMRHMPAALVWGATPARPMWLWARTGDLEAGDMAPDFTLPTTDHRQQVTLSSYRQRLPVVLVFGSYT